MRTRKSPLFTGWLVSIAILMAVTSLIGTQPAAAAARKLNGNLALGANITHFTISPDSSTLVYMADQATSGVIELYSIPLTGGTPTKLNGALPDEGNVEDFAISPDSSTVVYLANQNDKEVDELFSVPIGGGTPIRLNGLMNHQVDLIDSGGNVVGFAISPDSSTVIYRADQSINNIFDLYTVSITRATPELRLNDPLLAGQSVQPDFAISPDGQRVVYRADQHFTGVFELFSVPLTGGATPAQLNPFTSSLREVLDFTISPNSSRVIFRGDYTNNDVFDLFNAQIAGSGTFAITNIGATNPNGNVARAPIFEARSVLDTLPYAVSPDNTRVIFIADAEVADNEFNCYSVPIGGGVAPTRLSSQINGNEDVTDFAIAPNSQRVIYRGDAFTDDRFELFTVPIDAPPAPPTSDEWLLPSAPPSFGNIEEFAISPDSSRVVYRGDFITDDVFELRSTPIDTSANTQDLNGSLVAGGDVGGNNVHFVGNPFAFAISPNSSRVVYRADQDSDGVFELYSVLITGGLTTKLNGAMVNNGNTSSFEIAPNSSRVVYIADEMTDQVQNLYGVPLTGGTRTQLTSSTSAISGDVINFNLSPNGAVAVYRADQETDQVFEIYSVALPNGAPVKLNGLLGPDGDVFNFAISPDSSRVIYIADQETDEVNEIFSVPIGGGTAIRLNPPLVAGGNVTNFKISPDGQRVVYQADQEVNGIQEIYSVPISGGASQRLSGVATGGGSNISDFAISPNSQRVVFLADQATPGTIELYTVAITGGSAPTLNGPLPVGGNVHAFVISPDSSRVVYVADQNTLGTFEIYSVPLNDGATTRLNSLLQLNGDIAILNQCNAQIDPNSAAGSLPGTWGFAISPDSSRVVYCADQEIDEVYEIYSVPISGGAAPAKLNLPPGINGDVTTFAISPDSQHVVYRADQNADNLFELFSTTLAGGSTPTRLNANLATGSNVGQFAISPDSSQVVYVADQRINAVFDLFSVPVGGGIPVQLSRQLPGDLTDVATFTISTDSQRVVYLADQNTDDVFEAYTVPIQGTRGSQLLSDPMVIGGDVFAIAIQSTTAGIVYHADQITNGVAEIFYSAFPPPPGIILPVDEQVEESVGTISLQVKLSNPLASDAMIGYTVSGTATLGDDYNISSSPLTFPANTTTRTITLTINQDAITEGDETIVITFNTPTANLVLPDPPRTTVTIKGSITAPPPTDTYFVYLPIVHN
ncbi:hypothetical protein EKD04_014460 [Chloroflexales bacterium ZM16-3]|nr:hypothetical protein [Chloroflexales bacterium ZM16-3]